MTAQFTIQPHPAHLKYVGWGCKLDC